MALAAQFGSENCYFRYEVYEFLNTSILPPATALTLAPSIGEIPLVSGQTFEALSGQVCQICGDDVGLTTNGDLFVACNVCAFPVCSPCYEYERKARNQSCPQCKTIYKMHKGSAKVEGDEGEEGAEDLGNEYHYPPPRNKNEKKKIALENVLWERGGCWCSNLYKISGEFPALSPEHSLHAPPSSGGGSKRVHPLSYTDATHPAQVRIVDHSRDFNSYGFGNVAWKERVERWKNKQEKNMLQVTNSGDYASEGKGGDVDFVGGENEDLQMNNEARQPL